MELTALHRKALSLYKSGQYADLEPVCRLILEAQPGNANAMHLLGLALKAAGNGSEACQYFRKAADFFPDNSAFVDKAANELLNLGDFNQAIEYYQRLLVLQPGIMGAYGNIGHCYFALGNPKASIRAYKKALEIDPDNIHVLSNMGNAFLALGRKQIATGLYDKAIRINPEFPEAYFHKHVAVFRDDDPSEAIETLTKASRLSPGNDMVKAYLAMLLDFSGRHAEATSLFREIERMAPRHLYLIDSWEYVKSHFASNTRLFSVTYDSLRYAFTRTMNQGLVMEFGVRFGTTINHISRQTRDTVYGFDSFEGLPEAWEGEGKGLYTTDSELPPVNSNVVLNQGWFEDTLPVFCEKNPGKVRFMNVDCDIYSSTRTIFDNLGKQITSGSVIVFDEYLCNPHWRDDEYKAFQEFVSENGIKYEYLLFSPFSKQAAVRIK